MSTPSTQLDHIIFNDRDTGASTDDLGAGHRGWVSWGHYNLVLDTIHSENVLFFHWDQFDVDELVEVNCPRP